ncbi:hypothetical protein M413DRAFT_29712 [Hebeloma cylindrosporum]|uniref:Uncharacterized protein n=1 Tax=Hebeloma cylindrosporum TaxID=76867 RepID=A0A0C2XND4_HEBCY|nr:hypothetical protein M413DRAFT_29712 [Hebeloma cylindrosporum h7]
MSFVFELSLSSHGYLIVTKVPLSTHPCFEISKESGDMLLTVQLGRKFATPPVAHLPDTSQRLMKKRAIASHDIKGMAPPMKEEESAPKEPHIADLMPDYLPHEFKLKTDKLIQQNIIDSEGKLVPCWNHLVQLHPGMEALVKVTLHRYDMEDKKKPGFRRYHTLDAKNVRILQDSCTPFCPTMIASPSPPADNEELVTGPSAQEEFDSFASKKRSETRAENVENSTPKASSSKAPKGRKAAAKDGESQKDAMDTTT